MLPCLAGAGSRKIRLPRENEVTECNLQTVANWLQYAHIAEYFRLPQMRIRVAQGGQMICSGYAPPDKPTPSQVSRQVAGGGVPGPPVTG